MLLSNYLFFCKSINLKITLDNECQYAVSFQEDVGVFTSLPDRRWKDFGGEEYSEEYGECDIFDGEVLGILGS
jgi:hypothetical protein